MSMMFIKVIIKDYSVILDYQVDHFGKKSTSQSKWPGKSQLFVRMVSGNQPDLDSDKKSKVSKKIRQNSAKCIKVIIWDYSLVQDYQLDHFC